MPIFPKQIEASNNIVNQYFCPDDESKTIRWVTLVSLMQSGKTGTYMLTIFEMFRLGKIEKAFIMCGTSDVALKSQLGKNLDSFENSYRLYLRNVDPKLDEDTRGNMAANFKSNVRIIWGSELKKISKELNNRFSGKPYLSSNHVSIYKALFVWDESHYAQSIGNQTEQFLTSVGISATGDNLARSDTYFLSVSATPFSECSDIYHLNQNKGIVLLKGVDDPTKTLDENYYGIKQMLETKKLIGYNRNNFGETLETAILDRMISSDDGYRYGLIRVTGNKTLVGRSLTKGKGKGVGKKPSNDESLLMTYIIELAQKYGIQVKRCDSEVEDIKMTELKTPPQDSHVIIVVKERCRIGDCIEKHSVGFAFETSVDANTDTTLQAFPGRFSGYTANRSTKIYIPEGIINSGELERYVKFIDTLVETQQIVTLPIKAKNIKSEKTHKVRVKIGGQKNIIPLKFNVPLGESKEYFAAKPDKNGKPRLDSRHYIENDVVLPLKNMERDKFIDNNNNAKDTEKIWEKLREIKDDDGNGKYGVVVKVVCRKSETYARVPPNLYNAFNNGIVTSLGSEKKGITIYIFGEGYTDYGFKKNDMFVDLTIEADEEDVIRIKKSRSDDHVPRTTSDEVFNFKLPTKQVIDMNGAMLSVLNTDTMCDCDMMKSALKTLVGRSLYEPENNGLVFRRSINALENQALEHCGIYVIDEIYQKLIIGGEIYNEILEEFKVELKLIRDPCQTSSIDAIEVVKLLEISW